ncbi:restriction endonuclease subunit S [Ligilactobacillus salivarius]|uniref:restriction endonuclease subunit S n=2 Tax=Ligilactobacillus salivarius TaxID=1624 RepID=UPI001369DCF3|nr:restriction endonuclease subunit S [Ligilactobacillus salivarius]MBM6707830.1 restriction endonuclease subunit S [Ligilactobacillus salivarius]MDE1542352.1 restriction endonuclease subunit S [Ligilactobacillus salivarius]MYV23865.1 restriction endonuclease subunit S [Ligilactobacillus salivarius]
MAKEEKKAPKLRFNGYTNDWERKKLGDVAEKVIQKNNNNAFKNVLTNSAEYGIISQRDFFERNIANKNNISTYYIVQNDDFVYNPRISNLAPYGPINRNKTGYTGIISPLYYVFRVLNINTAFIEWYFKTTCWHKFMYQHGDSGARSDRFSIKDNELKKLPIKLPADDMEQEKIAKTLTSLDNTLQLHERKCEELALIKKALLQKLFPKKDEFKPEVRYKNFSDAWEQRKLGEVATFINGRAYKQNELLDSGKYKVLRVGNFYTNDSWYYSNLELADKYYIDKGDLVYTWSATFGPHIWDGEKVIYHYHIWKIELSESLDRDFTLQILEADKAKLLANTNGSTMIHVTKKDMESKVISLPNIEEQKQIGSYLMKFDSLIALHQRKLEKLKQLKKFLLQNMFI